MEENFVRVIEFVLEREAAYVNHPEDPGGATNMGITQATLGRWRGHDVTEAAVQRLTRQEAVQIYHQKYWSAASCPALPAGVDLLVMDACVLSGVDPALNFLRAHLGLAVKLRVNKVYRATEKHLLPLERQKLLDRLEGACLPAVLAGVSERRRAFYRSLDTFDTFGKGWLRRVDAAQLLAMRLWAEQSLALS
jgi:lysozyme family protein